MRWLILERSASTRKRQKDKENEKVKQRASMAAAVASPMPVKPPLQARRQRIHDAPPQISPVSDKLRRAKEGSNSKISVERPRGHKRADTAPTTVGMRIVEDEQDTSKKFTVANVGAGGILFLKPTRVAAPHLNYAPATPPATSDGESSVWTDRPLLRESYNSGSLTPRPDRGRMLSMAGLPVPPLSLTNANQAYDRRRTRSHSESTVDDRLRLTRYDVNDFQLRQDGERTPRRRRRSSADLSRGLVDVYIPHYRLGTPRFSDRGTAYLHYSMATNSTDGIPSSVISRTEYDKLFPIPPGRGINSFYSHLSAAPSFLHPGRAYSGSTVSRTPFESQRPSTVGIISPALFNKLESNLDDPSVVHYHPTTGRIVAATPARLIAQITSPQFLDYELLADFFLTYRCFMHSRDVLDFLFARLRWAFVEGNDAGRIARVRTFVALRHWILNYFQDDFMPDGLFRQNFCDLVNDLCRSLRERPDRGGGDMNIVSELKKCWRRTCVLYWPIPDAHEMSPDADIVPGGDLPFIPDAHSSLSLPLTIRPTTRSHSIFEVAQIPLPSRPERGLVYANIDTSGQGQRSTITSRTASIPASPLSDQSLEVLSCSVPFLRNLRPTARAREKASPPKTLNNKKATRPTRNHKRSGSFSDALRDKRTPLSSPKADNIELKDLPAFAITGGLVRGILLQPSPAKVDNNVPVTPGPPGPELTEARLAGHNDGYFNGQHNGVKKFVGEVRRALSSRKASSGSPSRSAGSGSDTESRGTIRPRRNRKPQPDMQQLPGPDRFDMLGVQIETSYSDAVDSTAKERAKQEKREVALQPEQRDDEKLFGINMNEKDLPDTPRASTPRPLTAHKDVSVPASKQESVDVMDFGRLNSHNTNVTTGSRSIVIVDATGAPELPMMSGGLPSLSSMSTDMMPYPLFRDREDFPPVPPIPKNLKRTSSQPPMTRAGEWDDRWRSSDERMHDLLTAPNPWEVQPRLSRSDSQIMRKSSSLMDPSLFKIPRIPHQLRRQPHGDNLRAAHHVHSLQGGTVRARSVDSARASTATRSVAYSAVTHTDESVPGGVTLPSHKLLEKKSSVSLLNTHSSQPALRPSFVQEAEALRGIPDTDVEGGIEDALLKLEGKIPSPANSNSDGDRSDTDSPPGGLPLFVKLEPQPVPLGEEPPGLYDEEPQEVSLGEEPEGIYLEKALEPPPLLMEMTNGGLKMKYNVAPQPSPSGQDSGETPATETQGASIYHLSESGVQSMSSQTEYPLPYPTPLEVPMTDSSASILPMTARLSRLPIHNPYSTRRDSSPESFPYERKPESIASFSNGHYPSFRPGPWDDQHGSFLLDDNETLSDISTEIADYRNSEEGVRSFYFDDDDHQPIRPFQPPLTPPSTAPGQGDISPDRRQLIPRLLPRDPGRPLKEVISQPRLQQQLPNKPYAHANGAVRSNRVSPDTRAYPSHLPFVLAYESEVIAEQLTIIEKDALDEVDWKDLISLHWSQNPPYVRNWVDYLNKENPNGIDIVIARFNLVVKWCISEIVLTDAPSERARAITKYIHIASHCHRMHNYASMYQITLALLSTDLSRLHRTWSLVALREKQMLELLERLCRPLRNFYSLRAEMETAFAGDGVIPFIGLYTHDLMFNALKSSRIEAPGHGGKEPLINFERYQTAASIIKNLLRLIEASSKYDFHPEPEALSKCLWIAALDDDEITRRSKALEA